MAQACFSVVEPFDLLINLAWPPAPAQGDNKLPHFPHQTVPMSHQWRHRGDWRHYYHAPPRWGNEGEVMRVSTQEPIVPNTWRLVKGAI